MPADLEFEQRLCSELETAVSNGEPYLGESLGRAIARRVGLATPRTLEIASADEIGRLDLSGFESDRLVVKLTTPAIAHKSDLGGVRFCAHTHSAVAAAVAGIRASVAGRATITGFSIAEYVTHDRALGGELLVGVRWTDDFGPVAVLGFGGLEVERLAGGSLAPLLSSTAATSPGLPLLGAEDQLVRFLTEPYRGRPARFRREELERVLTNLLEFAETWMAAPHAGRLSDVEFNPVVEGPGGLTALDSLVRPAAAAPVVAPDRPLEKLTHLFEPASIAIAGVSRQRNIGRLILDNVLAAGFERERLWIIKPEAEEIAGCRCVPSFRELAAPVDLAVLSVAAARLPALLEEIVAGERAESVILIPGGVGEKAGSEALAEDLRRMIRKARSRRDAGPVINGGNCLGIRSVPGSYDTLFIPSHKLTFAGGRAAPLAILSQSGAFAVASASKLASFEPRYVVTFGNQIDLTLGDYLTYLERDPEVSVFACYVEGFRPLDGRKFLEAVRSITRSGRTVILYRAGRTIEGARAAASHTASVAGGYRVTRELTERAGGLVVETIADFEDLLRAFTALDGREPTGRRLGAMSNAGFECVAVGDNSKGLELAELEPRTRARLAELLRDAGVESIVAATNPLDVTPVLADDSFAAAAAALLDDQGVDVGLVGCVPLTEALQTLPAGPEHDEDLHSETAVGKRLVELWRRTEKPWVVVVDAGSLYDPLARDLERAGLPTFRSTDRALAALARWVRSRRRS